MVPHFLGAKNVAFSGLGGQHPKPHHNQSIFHLSRGFVVKTSAFFQRLASSAPPPASSNPKSAALTELLAETVVTLGGRPTSNVSDRGFRCLM